MPREITADVLESYVACRYKGHLKLAGTEGNKNDFEQLILETRKRVLQTAIAHLVAQFRDVEDLHGGPLTLPILKRRASLILNAELKADGVGIHIDAVQRVDGASHLGDFHYVPVLISESERTGREPRAQLEALCLVLGDLQGRVPSTGRLMHGAAAQVKKPKVNVAKNRTRQLLKELRDLQAGGTPPRLVRNPHCQRCEFNARCQAEANAKDDLSLLRGITDRQVQKYARRGIFTVTQLSCTFRPVKQSRQSAVKKQLLHQPALQALSIREKMIHVVGTPEIPGAPTEIFLDVEGDPDRGFDYLIGILIEKDGREVRHSLWANRPGDELQIFQEFLDVVGRQEDYRLYAYGSYESNFLRRMAAKSGRANLVAQVLVRTFNILSVLHSHVYLPTYSNGLKDVGNYLGFQWTESDASGLQSIVWRRRWEEDRCPIWKEKLTKYNLEDCAALRKVTHFLRSVCVPRTVETVPFVISDGHQVARVEELSLDTSRREWGKANFVVADFEFVNERAYFDYQRDRVYIRTNTTLRKKRNREKANQGLRLVRPNEHIEIIAQKCPCCQGTQFIRVADRRLNRLAYDLRITYAGIKRWVKRFSTTRHRCKKCQHRFIPAEYLRLDSYLHSLKSWAMYKHIAHGMSFKGISAEVRKCFGLPIPHPKVWYFKHLLAHYCADTYQKIQERLVAGAIVHADETEVHLMSIGKAYVWVFTNLEEVLFVYRKSREGDFLKEFLTSFRGVLISDFFSAYDSLPCNQQKCLVHLLRDFNHDIQGNPWDDGLKALASDFGRLLRIIIATVDRYGLKARHLGKHLRDVDRFYSKMSKQCYQSEVADGYQKRLIKYREKLFTFLNHDGVPWNNNNAEHAVKTFARYRVIAEGLFSVGGLTQHLTLLSIYATCKYKGISFLKFLLSGEKDIDKFKAGGRRGRPATMIELVPEGINIPRSKGRLYADDPETVPT